MKLALVTFVFSLFTIAAHAAPATDFRPLFPLNTQPESMTSNKADQEKSEADAKRYYSNICCVGYGYYCYLPGRYPVGYDCYCYSRGYYYYGYVCRY